MIQVRIAEEGEIRPVKLSGTVPLRISHYGTSASIKIESKDMEMLIAEAAGVAEKSGPIDALVNLTIVIEPVPVPKLGLVNHYEQPVAVEDAELRVEREESC